MTEQRISDQYWGYKSHKLGSRARVDPYTRLAAGVVSQAAQEAQEGDLSAAEWLAGDECDLFCEVVGLDYAAIQRKAERWMREPAGALVVRISV